MKKCILAMLGAGAVITSPAKASDARIVTGSEEAASAEVDQAFALIGQKQPAQALDLLAPLIDRFNQQIAEAEKTRMVFCGPTLMEASVYAVLPAIEKKDGLVMGRDVCDAFFAKAYALVELDRKPEALATLQRLTSLAPMHSRYLVELGYAYRINGQNGKAEDAYRMALEHADLGEDDKTKSTNHASALRGIGYMLVEKRDLAAAENAYKKSLKYDPDSAIAKGELEFIAQQRKRAK
ncbi:tetratricopeptide repeat protein [Novosphingobium sp. YJ-S2-02]|uniref:Tetratricopeptide repeat protein n=1 Tax=Novosphingobium aureum TaxID=2792964 RepID=A0A931HGU8_9SPHN|nr:tetratricopeptide repeat protein [Novosphingobium aureum]MBH0115123.1 tetratricopeptide repeat protein [Novosphingobium aureum]